jgi:general secretion pathway protein N
MMFARPDIRRVIALLALGAMTVIGQEPGVTQEATRPVASLTPPGIDLSAGGNPLWSVPLTSLAATRNRPIFSTTRRPPPDRNLAHRPRPSSLSSRPPFVLVGAIAADSDSIAILVDGGTKAVVRLRQGESHRGWTLQSVKPREVTLRSDRRTAVLELGSK